MGKNNLWWRKSEHTIHLPGVNNHSHFFHHTYKVVWGNVCNDVNALYLHRCVAYIVGTFSKILRTPCFFIEYKLYLNLKKKGKKKNTWLNLRKLFQWSGRAGTISGTKGMYCKIRSADPSPKNFSFKGRETCQLFEMKCDSFIVAVEFRKVLMNF